MQIINFVRAKLATGGELGVEVACRVPLKIDQMAGKATPNRFHVSQIRRVRFFCSLQKKKKKKKKSGRAPAHAYEHQFASS